MAKNAEPYKGYIYESRIFDAEGLYLRFVNYCCSIYYLLKGTESPIVENNKFLDPGSINVLCRAALESYLVLYYVFFEAVDKNELELRYDIWLRQGTLIRIKQIPILVQHRNLYESAKRDDEKLKNNIENNPHFKRLNARVQKEILTGKDWRIPIKKNDKCMRPSFSDIAIAAGIPTDMAKINYDFLSGYSHSGSLGVQQVHQAKREDEKEIICDASVYMLYIIAPMLAESYKKMMSNTPHSK